MHLIMFTGNIGDVKGGVELKHTPKGTPYCVIPVAVNPPKGSNDPTVWYRATLWTNVETAVRYAEKGKPILVVGRPSVHEWTGRDGRARYEIEVSASHWEFTGDGLGALFREAELVEREVVVSERERHAADATRAGADART
jgi:single-stranded DNA-binding protein